MTSLRETLRKGLVPIAKLASRGRPRILMYHRFGNGTEFRRMPAQVFEQQLRYLQEHYSIVPLRDVVAHVREGRALPPNAVAITVDDAYDDFHTFAYPLLSKYRIPATLYVVAAFSDDTEWLWMDKIQFLVRTAAEGGYRLNGFELELRSVAAREAAWGTLADHAIALTPEKRNAFLSELSAALGVQCPQSAPPAFRAVSWQQLEAMDATLIEVGCHSMTHPILSLTSATQQESEIVAARALIEARLQRRLEAYCYPNGRPQDIDANCEQLAAQAGYTSAVLAIEGLPERGSNPYRIPRIGAAGSVADLARQLDGVSWLMERMKA